MRALASQADVVVENFRPGALEQWNLGYETLSEANPGLVMVRISGYGQTGPYRDRPGFGVIGEAMGGLRYLTAEPGRIPIRVGVSIGDSIAALHGMIGLLMALYHRQGNGGRGQVVDVALYESVFNMMESLVPEYDAMGVVREPAGSALPGIAPSNAYRCEDGILLIGGNADGIFRRLMRCIGREDLAQRADLQSNAGRVACMKEVDDAIEAWTLRSRVADALEALDAASVPAGRVYSVADIARDPQYLARDMIVRQHRQRRRGRGHAGSRAEAERDARLRARPGAAPWRAYRRRAARSRRLRRAARAAARERRHRIIVSHHRVVLWSNLRWLTISSSSSSGR